MSTLFSFAFAPVLLTVPLNSQGALGDCWLAAALSIVTQQPLLLHALFAAADIRAGVYTVRLFHEGGWRFIMVDDYVPVSTEDGRPLFAHAKSRQELWVPVLEKAFAKLYGSYVQIYAVRSVYTCQRLIDLLHSYIVNTCQRLTDLSLIAGTLRSRRGS